jgi:hypothetical protein
MPEHLTLLDALERQRRDHERERGRRVRAFANRMRLAGFGAMLVGVLLTMLVQAWGRALHLTWLGYVMAALLLLTWAYSCALLIVFWQRTHFTAHVFNAHWSWMAVLVGVPIDLVQVLMLRTRAPATLALILVGMLLWRWRTERAEGELRTEGRRWARLFGLSWNDLLLMRFPDVRQDNTVST